MLERGGLKKKKGNSLDCKCHLAQPNCNDYFSLFVEGLPWDEISYHCHLIYYMELV